MLIVIGRFDIADPVPRGCGRWGQLFQILDRPLGDSAWIALLGGQIEEHDRHIGVGQMRGDLCAHHTGAEHRGFPHLQRHWDASCTALSSNGRKRLNSCLSFAKSLALVTGSQPVEAAASAYSSFRANPKKRGYDDLVFKLEREPYLRAIGFHLAV